MMKVVDKPSCYSYYLDRRYALLRNKQYEWSVDRYRTEVLNTIAPANNTDAKRRFIRNISAETTSAGIFKLCEYAIDNGSRMNANN